MTQRFPALDAEQTCDVQVVGASGAVGRYLLRRLIADGRRIAALSRSAAPGWASGWAHLTWVRGGMPHTSLKDMPSAPILLSAGPLDALADACSGGLHPAVRRVVALSSMSIEWKRTSLNPAEGLLAQRLMSCEQALQATLHAAGVELVLLRAGMIYGAGIDTNLTPLLRFAQRWRWLPWPGFGRGLRCPVHADDLAAAILASAQVDALPGCPLRLAGGETLPFHQLIDRLLANVAAGTRRLPLPLPLRVCSTLAKGRGRYASFASVLARSGADQCVDTGDWQRLNLLPRMFQPTPDDFEPWAD